MARSTTYKLNITVVNPGSGNKYYIDGIQQTYISLFPGCTYEWNQDDSSNSGHPLRFATQPDAANSSEYTTGVTTSGTPGSATAWTKIEVTGDTPYRLYYYCTNHSGMGNTITVDTLGTVTRGVQAGNYPSQTDRIIAIDMTTTGKVVDFSNLTSGRYACAGAGNKVIGYFAGGSPDGGSTELNDINRITYSSYGNAVDDGDLSVARHYVQGTGNDTRAIFSGGVTPSQQNVIDYKEFGTGGNASDFGDLTQARNEGVAYSSTTRGIYAGGDPSPYDIIDYVTIASTGNATDFGDLTVARGALAGSSSATRGVEGGGSSVSNVIDYITIASTGNATDFGDLSQARQNLVMGISNKLICMFGGGKTPSDVNTIDRVDIATTGNAVDWGDLLESTAYNQSSTSNGHGGLS